MRKNPIHHNHIRLKTHIKPNLETGITGERSLLTCVFRILKSADVLFECSSFSIFCSISKKWIEMKKLKSMSLWNGINSYCKILYSGLHFATCANLHTIFEDKCLIMSYLILLGFPTDRLFCYQSKFSATLKIQNAWTDFRRIKKVKYGSFHIR